MSPRTSFNAVWPGIVGLASTLHARSSGTIQDGKLGTRKSKSHLELMSSALLFWIQSCLTLHALATCSQIEDQSDSLWKFPERVEHEESKKTSVHVKTHSLGRTPSWQSHPPDITPAYFKSRGMQIACPNKNIQHVCDIVKKRGETDKAPFRTNILDSYVNTSSVVSSCQNCPQS